jgi:hypothetical protein
MKLLSPELLSLLPFFLYAEMHYRWRFFPSFIFKREPEIIVDLPWRLNPGEQLPVLLLVKDADTYPIVLRRVALRIQKENNLDERVLFSGSEALADYLWHRVFSFQPPEWAKGWVEVEVRVLFNLRGRDYEVLSDNYRGLSHKPFRVYFSDDNLPAAEGWFYGDIHTHSHFTDDQVEFGVPPEVYHQIGKVLGLSWIAVTDHSYDLDDHPGFDKKRDPNLTKWLKLQEICSSISESDPDFVMLFGEELSCGNSHRENLHFLILEHPEFIHGAGDSAEKWFFNGPDLKATEVAEKVRENGGLAIAAHPKEKPTLREKIFLNRGHWRSSDLEKIQTDIYQIWNGRKTESFFEGKEAWIRELLKGRKKLIVAGSDAHGNFNRLRQVNIPFLSFKERDQQVFGQVRSAVSCEGGMSKEKILEALSRGRAILTEGPFAQLAVVRAHDRVALMGGESSPEDKTLLVEAISTPEFGKLKSIQIIFGDLEKKREIVCEEIDTFKEPYRYTNPNLPLPVGHSGYLRLEVTSEVDGKEKLCLTNPIWLRGNRKET